MADFATHGLEGAATCALLPCLLNFPVETQIAAASFGFVTGAWADVAPFFIGLYQVYVKKMNKYRSVGTAKFFKWDIPYAWAWYTKYHHDPKWLKYTIGGTEHYFFDKPFHKIPGENWFPRLWWLWLIHAGIGVVGNYFIFFS